MHEKRERVVTQKYTYWKCDFPGCTISTEDNRGCCGSSPIMTCDFCNKDLCTLHINVVWDDISDYPLSRACDECVPLQKEYVDNYYKELEDDNEEE